MEKRTYDIKENLLNCINKTIGYYKDYASDIVIDILKNEDIGKYNFEENIFPNNHLPTNGDVLIKNTKVEIKPNKADCDMFIY